MVITEYPFESGDSRTVADLARILKLRLEFDRSANLPQLLAEYRAALPNSVLRAVAEIRTGCLAAVFTFSQGCFEAPPATPAHYIEKGGVANFTSFQLAQLLCFSVLGEPVGYRYVRGGSLISNIIPISEHARASNVTSNYASALGFHTEDAFHPHCADYLALGCLRNDEKVATWLSGVAECELESADWDLLAGEAVQLQANKPRFDASTYPTQRVLSNQPSDPLLRLPVHRGFYRSPDANTALDRLVLQLQARRTAVCLRPQQILAFDNARVAHARDPYEAKVGAGTGARWLSRSLHLRDLVRAAAYLEQPESHVLS